MARLTPTWVYVITCGEHTKIGLATDVTARHRAIQCGNPYEVAVFGMRLFPDYSLARKVEMDLHRKFAEHRGYGEWFRVEAQTALDALIGWDEANYVPSVKRHPGWTDADMRMVKALAF
jgi:hypothetical protein